MAVDMFLKIDGVPGESQDDKHKGEIDIMSFSFGVTQVGSRGFGGGGGAGRVSFQDIHFSAPVNVSSPKLMLACTSGQHFQKCVLTCRKAGNSDGQAVEFLKIELENVLVSSYSNGSHQLDSGFSSLAEGDNEVPTDQFSFRFQKISVLYTSPNSNPAGTTGLTGAADVTVTGD